MPLFGGIDPGDLAKRRPDRAPRPRSCDPDDPDFQPPPSGNPDHATRRCARRDFLYVEYNDGEREFYDLRTDPFELHNLAPTMTLLQLFQLHQSC